MGPKLPTSPSVANALSNEVFENSLACTILLTHALNNWNTTWRNQNLWWHYWWFQEEQCMHNPPCVSSLIMCEKDPLANSGVWFWFVLFCLCVIYETMGIITPTENCNKNYFLNSPLKYLLNALASYIPISASLPFFGSDQVDIICLAAYTTFRATPTKLFDSALFLFLKGTCSSIARLILKQRIIFMNTEAPVNPSNDTKNLHYREITIDEQYSLCN